MTSVREKLSALLCEQGLLLLGVVRPILPVSEFERYDAWIADGMSAEMDYMVRHMQARRTPDAVLDGAKSVVCFALPYSVKKSCEDECLPIAKYARLRDYHKVMRKLADGIVATLFREGHFDAQTKYRITIDTAPVLERALAARSSAGFIGKNTCFIHPKHGSFLLLGEIHLDCDLPADTPATVVPTRRTDEGGCGTCRRCQVHCPTGALDQAYRLDARRCLAYWTIEHRGTIPEEFWRWIPQHIFGCDICQDVCPYNRGPRIDNPAIVPRHFHLSIYDLSVLSSADYERVFGGTPVTRAKRDGLRRNALLALAATSSPELEKALAAVTEADCEMLRRTRDQIRSWQDRGKQV